MALTDEQRSMLQLLLEGGQSYEDIGGLLGIGPDEVRSRVHAVLREMAGGVDPDAQVPIMDYLLGQADPIGRADAVRHLQNDAQANVLAGRMLVQLRLLAPRGEFPELPAPRPGAGKPGLPPRQEPPTAVQPPGMPPPPAQSVPPAPPPPSGSGGPALSSRVSGALGNIGSSPRRRQIIAGVAGIGLLVLLGVLFIAGAFDGGDDSSSDDGGTTASTASTASEEGLVIARLGPLDASSDASGQAVFAQAQDQPLLQINLSGLPPAPNGQTYIVWLFNSDRVAFPLARDQVGKDGNLTGAAAIPTEVAALLSQFGCVDVSLAANDETQQALQAAVEGQSLPPHVGESVLRGEIPTGAGQEAASGPASQCERAVAPDAGGAGGGGGGGGGGNGGGGDGAGGNSGGNGGGAQ